jgi:hypothetical protein
LALRKDAYLESDGVTEEKRKQKGMGSFEGTKKKQLFTE